MNKLKLAAVSAGAFLLFGVVGIAFATTPETIHINSTDSGGTPYIQDLVPPSLNGSSVYIIGLDPTTGSPIIYNINSGLAVNGSITGHNGQLDLGQIPSSAVQTLDNFKSDTNSSLSSLISNLASATSSVSSLNASIAANMQGTSTTLIYGQNGNTSAGLLDAARGIKLDALSATLAWTSATSSHSIVTGTGATGFQVSSTRNATVNYNVKITTTASIAGNADGYLTLEVAPTNSATSTDWVEVGRCGNSQALTLAITLQSIQGTTCQLSADLPTGTYAKLRSVTTTGTVSFAYVSGRETLK